jgi:hypothetical protein
VLQESRDSTNPHRNASDASTSRPVYTKSFVFDGPIRATNLFTKGSESVMPRRSMGMPKVALSSAIRRSQATAYSWLQLDVERPPMPNLAAW